MQNELKPYKNSFNDKYIEDYTASKVMQKLKEGKLITSPDDPRKFDHNPHLNKLKNNLKGVFTGGAAPINDGKTFFATEDIDKMSNSEFSSVEDIIKSQLANRFAVPKAQAQVGVYSGNYIYVREYVRDDGTRVRGYYRIRG